MRPFTESDWQVAAPWLTDERVLWFSEGDDVPDRPLAETQSIYRAVSQTANIFLIVDRGTPVGDGWVQRMNLARIIDRFGDNTARIDLQLMVDSWGRRIGTRAIRALTAHAFERGFDLVFGVDIGDYNERSRRAFLRARYVPWRRVKTRGAPKTRLVNHSGTPTLRAPLGWPWASWFTSRLAALRALPDTG